MDVWTFVLERGHMWVKSVRLGHCIYRVIRSPDPLSAHGRRAAVLIDREQRVIWVDPDVDDGSVPLLLHHVAASHKLGIGPRQ